MTHLSTYRYILASAVLSMVLLSACEREPVTDDTPDTGSLTSELRTEVVRLDTLVFSNPVYTNGTIRFDLIGTAPAIKPGDVIYYPSSEPICGKVLTITEVGFRLFITIEEVRLDQIFSTLSLIDTLNLSTLHVRNRTQTGTWIQDTLRLNGTYLYDGFWDQRLLQVQINQGRLGSSAAAERFAIAGQGSNPWFDRCRLDFDYSIDFSGDVTIKTGKAMDASDSLLVERSVYGPFLIDGFPITYQIDTWLGFHIVTYSDTTLTINWSALSRGNLSAAYNYWEAWQFKQNKQIQAGTIGQFAGPMYSGYTVEMFISQRITPRFAGSPSLTITNRLTSLVATTVNIPVWESAQSVRTEGFLHAPGKVMGEFVPGILKAGPSLLYSENQTITLQNQRPVAAFSIDPAAGFTDTNFKFDASGCTDLETPSEALSVRWDFDGDNHFDTEFSTNKVAFNKYPQPGIYVVILEVQDEKGLTARNTRSVEVTISSSAPVAHFSVLPESGRTSDIFIFDAYGSYDAEDNFNQLKVRWDFDGDGIWDTSWSTRKIEYFVFREEGKYVAKLEVLDTQGLSGSTTRIINVDRANIKPTAFFTVEPATGTIQTRFNFDASGSTDPEDPVENLQVRWDWENDGVYDTEFRTIKTIQHIFPVAGNYTVVLQVIDSEGYGSTYSVDIVVTNPNTPPQPNFTISPEVGYVGMEITFDASSCSDAEDSIEQLEVRWDWNYDNQYDTPFAKQKVFRRSFDATGTYIIKLEVKDSGGLTDTRVKLLEIR